MKVNQINVDNDMKIIDLINQFDESAEHAISFQK